jgi:drug/metabolite transporter (DMT)-like permease
LFGYAALHLTGGLAAIFNAATPLCGALIAWAWLHEQLTRWRIAGLALGFVGVAGLALVKAGAGAAAVPGAGAASASVAASFTLGGLTLGGPALAVAACLLAPMFYGFAACYTRRFLVGVPSMAAATGSQLFAALALAIPAAISWPAQAPSPHAWAMLAVLAAACTGLAYILYFKLIAGAGAAFAMTVTYLVPAFAVIWGAIFIGEQLTAAMLLGCAVILTGTALATGLLPRRKLAEAD